LLCFFVKEKRKLEKVAQVKVVKQGITAETESTIVPHVDVTTSRPQIADTTKASKHKMPRLLQPKTFHLPKLPQLKLPKISQMPKFQMPQMPSFLKSPKTKPQPM